MLCLTCHHLCHKNLPHPLLHSLKHINKHTLYVPSPQSASAEVTRQVAANKALRAQLQEKEDKLCQLQDKLVSHLSFHQYYFFLFVFLSYYCSAVQLLLPILISASLSLSLSLHLPVSLSACLHILYSSHM